MCETITYLLIAFLRARATSSFPRNSKARFARRRNSDFMTIILFIRLCSDAINAQGPHRARSDSSWSVAETQLIPAAVMG